MQNMQKARKINIQFLLRFFGEKQIWEAFYKLDKINDNKSCLVIFYDAAITKDSIIEVLERHFVSQGYVINLTSSYNCEPDITTVMNVYNISRNEVEAVSRNDISIQEKLIRILLERIALSFLK